jgi:hypothetical protein
MESGRFEIEYFRFYDLAWTIPSEYLHGKSPTAEYIDDPMQVAYRGAQRRFLQRSEAITAVSTAGNHV